MNIDQLEYIFNLKETQNITQTAKKFFISQQALSKSLISLEKELNVTLLIRSNQGVHFTEAGEIFYKFASTVLTEYQRTVDCMKPYQESQETTYNISGNLLISAIPRFFSSEFFQFSSLFEKKYPNINISIHSSNASSIIADNLINENSIGLITCLQENTDKLSAFLQDSRLSYKMLYSENLSVVCSNKSKLSQSSILSQADLTNYRLVAFNFSTDLLYDKNVAQFTANYFVDSFEQQKILMKDPDFYTLCTTEEFKQFSKHSFSLIPLQDEIKLFFLCIYSSSPSDIVNLFIREYTKCISP